MFGIGLFVLIVSALALVGGLLKKMRAGRIAKTPFASPSQIQQNGRNLADAKGSISTEGQLRHGALLTSPVTNAQCLFYELKLEAKWKVGDRVRSQIIVERAEAAPFAVADVHGMVGIALDPKASSDYDLSVPFNAKRFTRGLLATMTGKPIEVTPSFSIPANVYYNELGKQWEVPVGAEFFLTERVLEPKPFFHVNGKLLPDGTIGSPRWTTLLVKEKNRAMLLADAMRAAKTLFVGGGACAGLGAILATVGLLVATPAADAPASADLTAASLPAAPAAASARPAAEEPAEDVKPKQARVGARGTKPVAKPAAAKSQPAASGAAKSR